MAVHNESHSLTVSRGNHTIEVNNVRVAVIGLGYVGLPLAIRFAEKYEVLGYDINPTRINELQEGNDHTREADLGALNVVLGSSLLLSSRAEDLKRYNTFIVTVPTPVDQYKSPDLKPLFQASEIIGAALSPGSLVIYESTVYPGCTEEECIPILEQTSGLKCNIDFFVGYSPERVSPGDRDHTLTTIKKITSGSSPEAANRVDALYRSIITAGTYQAPSIKVAEAAKAIENAQRDINISFVNELALIFDRMGIDTHDVLEAASTKWNFLPFKPGLVGGHCIGVDPYYLVHKAQKLGYIPDVILSGRRINEQMGAFVAGKVIKLMLQKDIPIKDSSALIMGITFKENCPDIRNSRVIDIYHELREFGLRVDVYDPWANNDAVHEEYGIGLIDPLVINTRYDAIIVAVAHREFINFDYNKIRSHKSVVFDTKACLDRHIVDGRL